MTVKTRADFQTDVTTYLPNNSSGDISPGDVRDRLIDLSDSAKFAADPTTGGEAVCQGRLTIESGVPISISDQTAKTSIIWTPYRGNKIGLYSGGQWVVLSFAELSLTLAPGGVGLTAGKPYDVFAYVSAGAVAIELLVWTDDLTRATAIALQDGIPVKSGDATRRLLGTIYTSATGQCEDSVANRYVGNVYNQKQRPLRRFETNSTWNAVNQTAFRQANASALNQVSWVSPLDGELVRVMLHAWFASGGANLISGIGLDSTTAMATGAQPFQSKANGMLGNMVELITAVAAGRHRATWLERMSANTSTTINGTNGDSEQAQAGLVGQISC